MTQKSSSAISRKFSTKTQCPVCASPSGSIKTYQVSKLCREVIYQCRNEACSCIFKAQIEPTIIIEPSSLPDATCPLPVAF